MHVTQSQLNASKMEGVNELNFGILLLLLSPALSNTVFVQVPEPVNATQGNSVQFYCAAHAIGAFWKVNNDSSHELDYGRVSSYFSGDHILHSTFSIPANNVTNGSMIQCVVYDGVSSDYDYSDPVPLLVQGPPSPVIDIQVISMVGSIYLSWTPPPVLNITNEEPDLWYTVDILNVSSQSIVPCLYCPLTKPQYKHTSRDPCDLFEFRIIASTPGGNASKSISGYSIGEPLSISGPDVDVSITTLLPHEDLEVKLSFPANTNSCPGEVSKFFRIYVKSSNDTVVYVSEIIPSVATNGSVSVIEFVLSHGTVTVGQVYSITIETENEAGSSNSTGNIKLCLLSSNDIDGAEVSVTVDGKLCVTCHFFTAEVLGCSFFVQNFNTDTKFVLQNIYSKLSSQKCINVPTEGNYTIDVYIIDGHGKMGETPAYILHTSVTFPMIAEGQPSEFPEKPSCYDAVCHFPCIGGAGGGAIVTFGTFLLCCVGWKCWSKKSKAVKGQQRKTEEQAVSMRQNLAYEDTQALRVTRGPQPADIEECPAYGVLTSNTT